MEALQDAVTDRISREELLSLVKEIVVALDVKTNPAHAKEFLKLQSIVDEKITVDSPLASLGWDSLQMTFLLVAVEKRLKIDTSSVSLFDLFTIGDFLDELQILVNQKRG